MTLFLILSFLGALATSIAVTLYGGHQLVRRREPDPVDTPENYGMAYESVAFPSRYKLTMRGWWIPHEAPRGTIIFCHGQNGSMAGDLPQARAFHQAGYNILMFDLRAHGDSDGDKMTYGCFEKEDLLGAIDFVRTKPNVDKVAVIGFSMGAAVATIATALSPHVSVLIVDGIFRRFLSAVQAELKRYLPTPLAALMAQSVVLGGTLLTNTRMYQVSPLLWFKHIRSDVAVLFIHAEQDRYTSHEDIQFLASEFKGTSKIWVASGSEHREGFKEHQQGYMDVVLGWLDAHYRP